MSKTNFGLKVSPDQVDAAIQVLAQYVTERKALAEEGVKKLGNVTNAAKLMSTIDAFKDRLQAEVKTPAEEVFNALRFTVIPNMMDEQDIRTINIEGVGRVGITDDISLSVVDKDAMFEWLTDNDLEDLIKPNVNAQTLAATVRKRIKEGKPLPKDNILKVTPVVRASITRS